MVVIGSIVSYFTAESDRAFVHPEFPVEIYGMTLENRNGVLITNGNTDDWQINLLSVLPDGTLAAALRRDPIGEPLVFCGYALFALGSLMILGFKGAAGVVLAIALVSLFSPANPALRSPWFPVHVGLIFAAYAMMLVLPWMRPKHARRYLSQAICLLGLGIAAGSVWASSAWGRYWGWDPKESGALAVMLLCCLPLHFSAISRKRVAYWLPLILLPLLLLLPGLHSYL